MILIAHRQVVYMPRQSQSLVKFLSSVIHLLHKADSSGRGKTRSELELLVRFRLILLSENLWSGAQSLMISYAKRLAISSCLAEA
jgi:hypothetical protein